MNAATTIFVTTIGDEANFTDCMLHLRAQTVGRPIEVIDHVAPMSAALQEMHRRCRTPFYVQVDEDMILFPQAIESLENRMRDAGAGLAMICAPLWDCDTAQAIYGVKIYRRALVRQFPYENTLSCEVRQLEGMKAAGVRVDLLPLGDRGACLDEHGKHYTPETIFKRWQRIFQKQRRLGRYTWVEPWPARLLERYLQTRDVLHLYALLGAVSGITGAPLEDREADWRETDPFLERIRRYFPIEPAEAEKPE
jgi:hypothetical protein